MAWFEVESEEWLGTDFLTFLTNYDEALQRDVWAKALRRINQTINSDQIKDVFLLIHTTCYREGRFFSAVSWDDLLLFDPDCIITLTDDLYDIWQRIEDGRHDTHLSLQEILNWRSVEMLYSKTLADNLKLDHSKLGIGKIPKRIKQLFGPPLPFSLMAVKHPIETFYKLIFERNNKPLVYASFPISRTRTSEKRKKEIDNFREKLKACDAIVVDPLTIDELRLGEDSPIWFKLNQDKEYEKFQQQRWPVNNPAVPSPANYNKNPFHGLTKKQIKELVKGLIQHVVTRDLRLVDQCPQLIAYRPFYPSKGSEITGPSTPTSTGGVTREINFASQLQKSVWVYHPRCDYHSEQDRNFFDRYAVWNRVRRFPKQSAFATLQGKDQSGFDDLLQELKLTCRRPSAPSNSF